MSSVAKTLTAIILIAVSLLIAYVTVRILEPFLPITAFLILIYFIFTKFNLIAVIREPRALLIAGLLSVIVSLIVVYIFRDLIKVIAFLLIGWYTFKILVRYYAKDVEEDLRAVFEES